MTGKNLGWMNWNKESTLAETWNEAMRDMLLHQFDLLAKSRQTIRVEVA